MFRRLFLLSAALGLLFAATAYAQQFNLNVPGGQVNPNVSTPFQGGSCTPAFTSATATTGTFTVSPALCSYEVTGRLVTVRINMAVTTTGGTGTNQLQVSMAGPPTSANTTNDFGHCGVDLFSGLTVDSGFSGIAGIITPGNGVINLYEVGATNKVLTPLNVANLASGSQVFVTCLYHQ